MFFAFLAVKSLNRKVREGIAKGAKKTYRNPGPGGSSHVPHFRMRYSKKVISHERAVRIRAWRGESERGICSSSAPANYRFLVAALLGMTISQAGAGRKKGTITTRFIIRAKQPKSGTFAVGFHLKEKVLHIEADSRSKQVLSC
jgi:hypothetical protein